MSPEADTQPQAEPTMEEILASIRKIIAADKPEESGVVLQDEILELTDIVPNETPAVPPAEPEVPPLVEEPPMVKPAPAVEANVASDFIMTDDQLVSDRAAEASAHVFADLNRHLQQERQTLPPQVAIGDGNQTLEGLITAIIRPLLKDWLDQNLPGTVERMVQREIERIARFHRE